MGDLISVVIPVFNGRRYLEDTLASLLAQTHQRWEALLVDDSSTDDSMAVLEDFARRDNRFRVFRKNNQRFACYGIRYGVERTSGDWFFYMSQDDRLSPDYLERGLAAAKAAEADIALGPMVYFHDDVEEPFGMPLKDGDVISGPEAFELSLDWRIHGFCLVRMSLIRRLGISVGLLNDDEYDTRRQFFSANRVAVSGGTFYYHMGNPQSITKKWDIAQLDYITVAHRLRQFARDNDIEHEGQIDSLLRNMSTGACLRSAKMVYEAYRSGNATKRDISQVMEAIVRSHPEWRGRSKALALGAALRPLTGSRLALTSIIKLQTLRRRG